MNYSFIIRKAVVKDAQAIKEILTEAFGLYIKETGITATLDALGETVEQIAEDITGREVFIATIDDMPVGTIRVKVMPDNTAYISRFGVSPQYHNIGIGKSLMNLVDKMLVSKGVASVSLHTASKYTALVRFYYGRGFHVDSVSKDRGYARALMVKEYAAEDKDRQKIPL